MALSYRELQKECMALRRGAAKGSKQKTRCRRPKADGTYDDDEIAFPCCAGKGVTKKALATLIRGDLERAAGLTPDDVAPNVDPLDYDVCRDLRDPSKEIFIKKQALKVKRVEGRPGVYELNVRRRGEAATMFEIVDPHLPLASGAYGEVFRGMLLFSTAPPRPIVLKVNHHNDSGDDSDFNAQGDYEEFYIHATLFCMQRRAPARANARVLRGAKIPRILFMASETDGTQYIGMERLKEEAYEYINRGDGDYERWVRFAFVLDQLCLLLARFQSACAFRHGDMHPKNVMVDDFGTVFLIDFGMASLTNDKGQRVFVRTCPLDTKVFNPCLDLLTFLSYVLDREIETQQAVGLTMFKKRTLNAEDYYGNARRSGFVQPRKGLIARFCHSVVEPFYDDVLGNYRKTRSRLLSKEERSKAAVASYLLNNTIPKNYNKRRTPLRDIEWRHHALYEDAEDIIFRPTLPQNLLKRLRRIAPRIRAVFEKKVHAADSNASDTEDDDATEDDDETKDDDATEDESSLSNVAPRKLFLYDPDQAFI